MSPLNWIIPPRRARWPYTPSPVETRPEAAPRRRSILWAVFRLLMTASFLALLAVVVYAYASGYRIVTVHGASMGDSVPLGSVVLGKTRPPDQVRVGDVILIREQREDGTVATPKIHRVINLYLRGQSVAVQTKGDSNPDPDPTEYLLGEETLVVEGHVPRLGYWISFAATPLGWALSVAVPLTTTVLIGLISLWRRKPAKRRRR